VFPLKIINDTDEILFCIPAVAENDDILLAVECRHHLFDHGNGKVKLRGIFFPHTISQRDGCVRALLPFLDGDAEHDADKAVAIKVIGAVVCGMINSFETSSNFVPNFPAMVSSTQRNTG